MKTFLCLSIFIFACSHIAFSQITENSHCLKISVLGPAGIAEPNESVTYTVNVDRKGQELKLEYIWSVSVSEILQGQGTQTISVRQPSSQSLTVTIEIKGLPENCSNMFSEHSIGDPLPTAEKIDEFSASITKIDKAGIDNFLNELQNDPNSQGYIIEKFKKNTSQLAIKNKFKKISKYIKMRGFDPLRITMVQDTGNENLTQFWRVPAGAVPPPFQ